MPAVPRIADFLVFLLLIMPKGCLAYIFPRINYQNVCKIIVADLPLACLSVGYV